MDLIHQNMDSVRASDFGVREEAGFDNHGEMMRLESLGGANYTLSKNNQGLKEMIMKPDLNDM